VKQEIPDPGLRAVFWLPSPFPCFDLPARENAPLPRRRRVRSTARRRYPKSIRISDLRHSPPSDRANFAAWRSATAVLRTTFLAWRQGPNSPPSPPCAAPAGSIRTECHQARVPLGSLVIGLGDDARKEILDAVTEDLLQKRTIICYIETAKSRIADTGLAAL
jgi:hypothetical protein